MAMRNGIFRGALTTVHTRMYFDASFGKPVLIEWQYRYFHSDVYNLTKTRHVGRENIGDFVSYRRFAAE